MDQIFVIKSAVEKYQRKGRMLYATLTFLEKVDDRVNKRVLRDDIMIDCVCGRGTEA